MTAPTRTLIAVGECLPKLTLPRSDSLGSVSLGDGTYASVVVFPHRSCAECAEWLDVLDGVVDDLRLWGTRPVAVLPPGEEGEAAGSRRYPLLVDSAGTARARIGLGDDVAALIVADRWGAVYEVTPAGGDHPTPHGAALVNLAQYIDMQCPECGAPGSEWRQCTTMPLG